MTLTPLWHGRRLSLVVVGNSVGMLQIPARPHLEDGTFGEIAADVLEDSGVPVELRLECRWHEFVTEGLRRYPDAVSRNAPDVLVLNYGTVDCQPYVTPVWLVRHLMTTHLAAAPASRWYRAHVAGPAWKAVRDWRRHASARLGPRTFHVAPRRFAAALESLIVHARYQFRPLVLVLDVNPPGQVVRHWLPGMDRRVEMYNRALRDVVERVGDPDVRLVEASRVVSELGERVATPDGCHYSALGHRRVGELVAAEILQWLEDRRRHHGLEQVVPATAEVGG